MATYITKIDCASGTFGVGTSLIGIFIISYFIYYYNLNNNSPKSFFLLYPLAFIFSGGANTILIGAFGLNFITQKNNIKSLSKILVGILCIFLLFQVISKLFFEKDLLKSSYTYVIDGMERYTSEESGELMSNQKLSRYKGPAYAYYKLIQFDKLLFGFGNSVYASSKVLESKYNKFSLNEVINLVPELMLKYGLAGLLINLIFYFYLLIYYFSRRKVNIYYHISYILVFIAIVSFMYTKPIYQQIFLAFIYFNFFKAEMLQKNINYG